MRIAHFSDLHVLALDGVSRTRLLNKRFTGWVNLKLKREHKHRPAYVRAIAREITRAKVDHVVITGDLTNLALEQEFEATKQLLEDDLKLDPEHVTVVPGNHDLYTRGALRSQRFTTYFKHYLESDLPDLAADIALGPFPVVKLRGPVAIIGLSSAVPRPPLMAAGELGQKQLDALERILDHPEVQRRMPVVALHHPIHNPPSRLKTFFEGLWDAERLRAALHRVDHALVLHGHLHGRMQRAVERVSGNILAVGATSASLHHDDAHRMAGFNLYEIDDSGRLANVEAHVFDPKDEAFHLESVPKLVA
jgi:3',5'-cyclic AMP phosphodiesterase CpdA